MQMISNNQIEKFTVYMLNVKLNRIVQIKRSKLKLP